MHARTPEGDTPLHLAATRYSDGALAELLLDAKAKVDAKNNAGKTPLYYTRYADPARVLVARGAAITPKLMKSKYWRRLYRDNGDLYPFLQEVSEPASDDRECAIL